MCTFFGLWPLIPEGYFDIDPPHDSLQALAITPYVLTPFTDRVFHIKLARYLTAFMSPPSWKDDQHTPAVVAEFAQRFQGGTSIRYLQYIGWITQIQRGMQWTRQSLARENISIFLSTVQRRRSTGPLLIHATISIRRRIHHPSTALTCSHFPTVER
jgi:hypothetical protein